MSDLGRVGRRIVLTPLDNLRLKMERPLPSVRKARMCDAHSHELELVMFVAGDRSGLVRRRLSAVGGRVRRS